jgi:phospholipid/cholesterol/gamma-HCH transport system substrate-binding protein
LESKTNYTLVGVIVLVLIVGLLSAMLWLSVGFNQKSYKLYTVYLHESASGLSKDAPVKFNGVQVGYVHEISLNKNDPRQVEILLNIESGTPITTSTSATLISQGITGVTHIGLIAGSADLTPIQKLPGEPYPVIPARPSLFNQLDALLKEVSENIGKITTQAQRIFNEKNARYVRDILSNVDKLTQTIANNDKNIDAFIKNLAKSSHNFPRIARELQSGISKFKVMADNLSEAGTSVSSTMNSGKDTLNKISQETIAPATSILRRLNTISANLEKVSSELRQNPAVVIRGTAPPKPGPGE